MRGTNSLRNVKSWCSLTLEDRELGRRRRDSLLLEARGGRVAARREQPPLSPAGERGVIHLPQAGARRAIERALKPARQLMSIDPPAGFQECVLPRPAYRRSPPSSTTAARWCSARKTIAWPLPCIAPVGPPEVHCKLHRSIPGAQLPACLPAAGLHSLKKNLADALPAPRRQMTALLLPTRVHAETGTPIAQAWLKAAGS